MHTHSAGGVIRNARGEIALVRHNGWFWGFPKGHVDPGETILQAARREIQEEVGLRDLTLIRELPEYTRYKAGDDEKPEEERERKTIHLFLFDTTEEAFHLTDPRHDEARWLPVGDVGSLLSNEEDRAWFAEIQKTMRDI